MVNIIHISDLHYKDEFNMSYLDNVIKYINENKASIDVVVCTGDLTKKGRYYEFEQLAPLLKRIEVPFLAVPGNTDVKNSGIIFYEQFFGPRRSKMILKNKDTLIIGVSSCKDDLKKGEISDEQLKWIIETIIQNKKKKYCTCFTPSFNRSPLCGAKLEYYKRCGRASRNYTTL